MVAEIGWTHNLVILEKCKDDLERKFYTSSFKPQELKHQLPAPEQVAKLLEGVE